MSDVDPLYSPEPLYNLNDLEVYSFGCDPDYEVPPFSVERMKSLGCVFGYAEVYAAKLKFDIKKFTLSGIDPIDENLVKVPICIDFQGRRMEFRLQIKAHDHIYMHMVSHFELSFDKGDPLCMRAEMSIQCCDGANSDEDSDPQGPIFQSMFKSDGFNKPFSTHDTGLCKPPHLFHKTGPFVHQYQKNNDVVVEVRICLVSADLNPIVSKYSELYESEKLADVTISNGDFTKRMHSFILATQSDVFATMLQSAFQEGQSKQIVIKDIDDITLERFTKFLYCGQIDHENMDKDKYVALLDLGNRYELPALVALAGERLLIYLDEDSCASLLALAATQKCESLKRPAIEMAVRNLPTVLKSEHFKTFDSDLTKELLEEAGQYDHVTKRPRTE